ncbi:uncharacterized protein DFL_000367 [Arthrobotrys flagrans]|uniref:Uncharacterized protein n=1 Tax=Arthrobotrys flagrans TaxID=97331 RepID=A0A437ADQ6_ARTFL|nr:hypothetical protein DFL_000367 [Arthrobotrys flagrans]
MGISIEKPAIALHIVDSQNENMFSEIEFFGIKAQFPETIYTAQLQARRRLPDITNRQLFATFSDRTDLKPPSKCESLNQPITTLAELLLFRQGKLSNRHDEATRLHPSSTLERNTIRPIG